MTNKPCWFPPESLVLMGLRVPSYLLLISGADVEAGDHDGGSWHQVDFGVGGAVVR